MLPRHLRSVDREEKRQGVEEILKKKKKKKQMNKGQNKKIK